MDGCIALGSKSTVMSGVGGDIRCMALSTHKTLNQNTETPGRISIRTHSLTHSLSPTPSSIPHPILTTPHYHRHTQHSPPTPSPPPHTPPSLVPSYPNTYAQSARFLPIYPSPGTSRKRRRKQTHGFLLRALHRLGIRHAILAVELHARRLEVPHRLVVDAARFNAHGVRHDFELGVEGAAAFYRSERVAVSARS